MKLESILLFFNMVQTDWKNFDLKNTSVEELRKIIVETPPVADKAIEARIHSKIILEIIRCDDHFKSLEMVRILHDIVTNDLKEVTDKSLTNGKFQEKLRKLISNYQDNEVTYIESVCNLCLQRTEIGVELSTQSPNVLLESSDKVVVKRFLHTLAHTMTNCTDYDFHMLIVDCLNERSAIIDTHVEALVDFWMDGDFMSYKFMRNKAIWTCFCRVVLKRVAQVMDLPASKDWLRKPEVIQVLHLLHYISVTDFTPPEDDEDEFEDIEELDEEDEKKESNSNIDSAEENSAEVFEEDPRGLLIKGLPECISNSTLTSTCGLVLLDFFKRGVSLLTNWKVETAETAGGPSCLAALGFFSSIYKVDTYRAGIFDLLVERIISDPDKFVVDAVDSASIIHVLGEYVSLIIASDDEKFVELLTSCGVDDGKEKYLPEITKKEEGEDEVRLEVISNLQKQSILKAVGLAAKHLRDNFDGTLKLALMLASLTLCEVDGEQGGLLNRIQFGKTGVKSILESKISSILPETDYESKLKELALVALNAD